MAEIHNYDSVNPNLKGCPFCGCIPLWHLIGNEHTTTKKAVVRCPDCGIEMVVGGYRWSVQEVANKVEEKWNKRV